MKAGYVYIMASGKNGTIYIGSTSDLVKRAYEHRDGLVDGFTNHVLLASTGRIPIVPVSLGRSAGAGTPLRSGIERAKQ